MEHTKYTVLILLLFLSLGKLQASRGDQDFYFQLCVKDCVRYCNKSMQMPIYLRLLRWNCHSNCKYDCMFQVTKKRIMAHQDVLQYYGKWPFLRWLGIQEPASAIFSMMNCLAQLIGFYHYTKAISRSYIFFYLTQIQSMININGWFWALVFHTRDTYWTEKLDYFSAAGMVSISIITFFARVTGKLRDTRTYFASITVAVIFGHHIYYMAFIKFDYGYNMKFLVFNGFLNILMWLCWCIKNYQERPYVWKCAVTMFCTLILALFELWDFPPIWWIFDSHSLWHLGTVPLSYLWYRFLIDDAVFETKNVYLKIC